MRGVVALAASAFLASCNLIPRVEAPVSPVVEVAPANALLAGVRKGPGIGALNLAKEDASAALASFRESCSRLIEREDSSGLTRPQDWALACAAAEVWNPDKPVDFFEDNFETARVGSGQAFATGYYEPEIAGSRNRIPGFNVPVYSLPNDLVRDWPGEMPEAEREGRPPLGRYDEAGNFVPYFDRAEIEDGALADRDLEIAWAQDPVEFFFLQIQGSGRLRAPDGTVMRIGYAGQNGRDYVGIGSVMRERGLIGDGPGQYPPSMQGIMRYLRERPEEGWEMMRLNQSWIFFRELEGDGPIGSLGVPVRGLSSVAADPAYVPLGAPVFLALDKYQATGLWIAQDTGGAIKGANRFDTFWGAGDEAREIAGQMSARGEAVLFLPKGTLKRLGAD